jgi:hypothetical protein
LVADAFFAIAKKVQNIQAIYARVKIYISRWRVSEATMQFAFQFPRSRKAQSDDNLDRARRARCARSSRPSMMRGKRIVQIQNNSFGRYREIASQRLTADERTRGYVDNACGKITHKRYGGGSV